MPKHEADINVAVTFRHTDSTPALKAYAIEKIENCVSKYVGYHTEAQIVLTVEKRDHIAEAKIHSKSYTLTAKAVTNDLYAAIDKVVDKIDAQLRKQNEKQQRHKSQARAASAP